MNVTQSTLDILRQQGPLSRADLSRFLKVSKPTISKVVRQLLNEQLIAERGLAGSNGGRRGRLLEFNAAAGYVIGMDIGGTTARAALANLAGELLAELHEPTEQRGAKAFVEQLSGLKQRLAGAAGIAEKQVVRVVLGTPGVLELETQRVRYAPNLPALETPQLLPRLEDALGVPVQIENDVNTAAIGERWQGAGRTLEDFAFLSIGTGVGVGLVLDGELYRGAAGRAGEYGYALLSGKPGDILEEEISGPALARYHRKLGGVGSSEIAFDEASRQLEPGLSVIQYFLSRLASAVITLATVLDPAAVVLGGGIGVRCAPFLDVLRRDIEVRSPISPQLVISSLEGDAGLYGALALALQASRPVEVWLKGGESGNLVGV